LVFNQRIKERMAQRDEEYKGYLQKPLNEIAKDNFYSLGYEEFSDSGDYGDSLLAAIFALRRKEREARI
jgi:hypothetical protein